MLLVTGHSFCIGKKSHEVFFICHCCRPCQCGISSGLVAYHIFIVNFGTKEHTGPVYCIFLNPLYWAMLRHATIEKILSEIFRDFTVCPKLFGIPKMYQKDLKCPTVVLNCLHILDYMFLVDLKYKNQISIWVRIRAKIQSFSKCQNSDHF